MTRYVTAEVDPDSVGELDPDYVPTPLTDAELDDLLRFLDALTSAPS